MPVTEKDIPAKKKTAVKAKAIKITGTARKEYSLSVFIRSYAPFPKKRYPARKKDDNTGRRITPVNPNDAKFFLRPSSICPPDVSEDTKAMLLPKLGHELLVHGILENNGEVFDEVENWVKDDERLNKLWKEANDKVKKLYSPKYEEVETMAFFMENFTQDSKQFNKIIRANTNTTIKDKLLSTLQNVMNKLSLSKDKDFISTLNYEINKIKEVLGKDNNNTFETTDNDDIRYSKKYPNGKFTFNNENYDMEDEQGILNSVDNFLSEKEDNFSDYGRDGENSDPYLKKSYVNKLERVSEHLYDLLNTIVDPDDFFDYETNEYDKERLDKIYAIIGDNEDVESLHSRLNSVIDDVDNGEYPNDDPPVYDNIQQLVNWMDSFQSFMEDYDDNYQEYLDDLEENKTEEVEESKDFTKTVENNSTRNDNEDEDIEKE